MYPAARAFRVTVTLVSAPNDLTWSKESRLRKFLDINMTASETADFF